jgi:hypothetical protein
MPHGKNKRNPENVVRAAKTSGDTFGEMVLPKIAQRASPITEPLISKTPATECLSPDRAFPLRLMMTELAPIWWRKETWAIL